MKTVPPRVCMTALHAAEFPKCALGRWLVHTGFCIYVGVSMRTLGHVSRSYIYGIHIRAVCVYRRLYIYIVTPPILPKVFIKPIHKYSFKST